jgi:hypothetical protein
VLVLPQLLLALGRERDTIVVLDDYPYLLEHTPELDSIIQRALGRRAPARAATCATSDRRPRRSNLVLSEVASSPSDDVLNGRHAVQYSSVAAPS